MQISREKLRKLLLYLLIILLVIRFFFVPLHREHKEKEETLMRTVKNYENALIIKSKSTIVSEDITNRVYSKEEISLIQTLLLSYIEDFCKKNNITIANFDLIEPSKYGQVTEINIALKLEGKPSQIIKFLDDIKRYPKILDVKNFEALETEHRYTFTIVLSTYRIEQ